MCFFSVGRHAQILTAVRAERDEAEGPPETDTAALQEGRRVVRARVHVQILRSTAGVLPIRPGKVHLRLRGKRLYIRVSPDAVNMIKSTRLYKQNLCSLLVFIIHPMSPTRNFHSANFQSSWSIPVELVIGPDLGISYMAHRGGTVVRSLITCVYLLRADPRGRTVSRNGTSCCSRPE